jgi:hypothetical protein
MRTKKSGRGRVFTQEETSAWAAANGLAVSERTDRQPKENFTAKMKAMLKSKAEQRRETITTWLAERGLVQPKKMNDIEFASWLRRVVEGKVSDKPFSNHRPAWAYIKKIAHYVRRSQRPDNPVPFHVARARQDQRHGYKRAKEPPHVKGQTAKHGKLIAPTRVDVDDGPNEAYWRRAGHDRQARRVVGRIMREE